MASIWRITLEVPVSDNASEQMKMLATHADALKAFRDSLPKHECAVDRIFRTREETAPRKPRAVKTQQAAE